MAKHLWHSDDNEVHFESLDGNDYLLCGLAYEGEAGDAAITSTAAPVTCSQCIAAVDFCKKIREREVHR